MSVINKKIAAQIEAHEERIIEIAIKRTIFLRDWIDEHKSADYGTRYDKKIDQYRKEIEELNKISSQTKRADYERQIYNQNQRISDLENILKKCYFKMEGYGEFEVIQRLIAQNVYIPL